MLKSACAVDFTYYKRGTIMRRLGRRLAVHKLETMTEYVALLETAPGEAHALCDDLLIRITEFFRDREIFDGLAKTVFPH